MSDLLCLTPGVSCGELARLARKGISSGFLTERPRSLASDLVQQKKISGGATRSPGSGAVRLITSGVVSKEPPPTGKPA
jgi:hypothetical protein